MTTRRILPALAVLTAGLVVAPGASGGGPQPPNCPLLSRTAEEHAIPGTALVARNPYGRLMSRYGSFGFVVVGPLAARAGVARVEWALDGITRRVDNRGPFFEWVGYSGVPEGIPAGDHTIKVTVVPKSGAPASVDFSLTATDCRYVDFVAFPPPEPGKGTTELFWDSAMGPGPGVPLTGVAARVQSNIVSELPSRLRGRTVGALTLERSGQPPSKKTLRAPRRGTRLLHAGALRVTLHPGANEFLTVTGLPAGTQTVRVVLRGRGTRLVHAHNPCRMALIRGILRAGKATASKVHGGHYAC